jgi:hypothetical protein
MVKIISYYPVKKGSISIKPQKNKSIKDFNLDNKGNAIITYREKGVKGYLKKPVVKKVSPPKNKKIIGIKRLKNDGFNISYGTFEIKNKKRK